METYTFLASLAQTWGLLAFVTAFALVLLYALLPANRATFEEAARQPLIED